LEKLRAFYQVKFVEIIYKLRLEIGSDILYHDARHTMDVIQSAERIAHAEELDELSILHLKIAALFHDTGYLIDAHNHELKSVELFQNHALGYTLDESSMNTIEELILATRVPQTPQNHLQSILCDADLDYLGRRDFPVLSEFLYLELLCQKRVADRNEWNQMQLQFLNSHCFHTRYASENRVDRKLQNIAELRHRMGIL
jgi:hypothetical protein